MSKTLRVLIVEDEEDDAQLLMHELRRGGYTLETDRVCTPDAMRSALAKRTWDIVISDWSMPQFNGMAAYRLMRTTGVDLPFIIVSGTISDENAFEALKAGVHDFMQKGTLARLLPSIERELREAEERKQRKAAEVALESQREESVRSERMLRLVLESVPDGVVVVDENGRFVLWNPAAVVMLGDLNRDIPRDGWVQHFGVFKADKTTPFPVQELALVRALEGEAVDAQEQFLFREGDLEGRWLSINARPLRHATDGLRGAVAVLRDVSKERAGQEQLLISDRMASIGMLAAGVGHEINNPLTAVLGNLELAQYKLSKCLPSSNDALLAEAEHMLTDAYAATERVRMIVRDLKIFSRHKEAGATAIDLHPILESSLRMAWNEIRHRARLEKSFEHVPLVEGSESRLGQMFLNLIVNAAQAMPEGHFDSNVLRVATHTDTAGRAVIEVADTGTGISPEAQRHLFTPFFTTKAVGVGTGLGLAICQRIVHELGGEISVESEVGKGTTFRVTLPGSVQTQVENKSMHPPATPSHRRGRVLVVDDEPSIGSMIHKTLENQHDVDVTTRATDAVERISKGEHFDVILCDLMMPQMSGMDLHARLNEQSAELADRLVFMTGGAFTQRAREFLANTHNSVVEKPFDPVALRALINARVG